MGGLRVGADETSLASCDGFDEKRRVWRRMKLAQEIQAGLNGIGDM